MIPIVVMSVLILATVMEGESLAQATSYKRTRLQNLDKGKQKIVDVDFQIGTAAATVTRKSKVLLEIPYSTIKGISYDGAQNRRMELGLALGALSSRSTSHWLFVEYVDGGSTKEAVLQIHKDDYEPVIAALQDRTGHQVTILTESRINPTEGSENVEEAIPHPIEQVRLALRPAMEMYGCQIAKEQDNLLECNRGRNENAAQGCGGEKVSAQLTAEGASTRVKIETGKGMVGIACKKNWSTPVSKEAMKLLASE